MAKQRRWTQEELDGTAAGKKKKGRYGNVRRPVHDGIQFDSKREYLRYMDLKLMERAGEISDIKVHPKYPITIAGIEIRFCGSNRHMRYEGDFTYLRAGKQVIEDVKMQSGHRTGVYKLKRALMRAMGYDITEY